ncbi:unnamed protein product [Phytomonas sp. EM1]|nr:unnamed protein product [Phytomonas sp. EM1]|eukprot:CCW63448.1 unnamed protein product [Phytomonas sp. isolate EM1]
MPELHIIGEIMSGHDFVGQSYFCMFEFVVGDQWHAVEGRTSGCTHIMSPGSAGITWSFPIDVHYVFTSVQGWPKISIQVWEMDSYGRRDLAGYGVAYIPTPNSSKEEEVEIATWKPVAWHPNFFVRLYNSIRIALMGGNPVLRDNYLIHTNDQRTQLHTRSSGIIRLQLNIISRGMKQASLHCK